jgi:hypothetical protein
MLLHLICLLSLLTLWGSSSWNLLQPSVISSLSGPNTVFSSTPCSQTLSIWDLPQVCDTKFRTQYLPRVSWQTCTHLSSPRVLHVPFIPSPFI